MNALTAEAPGHEAEARASLPVERRSAETLPYRAFVRDYVARNRPVVVEHALQGCPALGKWTPEYFRQRFGKKTIQVSRGEQMAFGDFIDAMLSSREDAPGPYLHRVFIGPHLPELLEDLEPPNPYAFPRRLASPLMLRPWRRPDGFLKLLMGGVGGRFPVMHYDGENAHATVTEIYGDKEFILYPPESSPFMYPTADAPNQSCVNDPHRPDLERFPMFSRAQQYRTVLHPGDMVFVPSRWWHTARVLSPSISIGQNMLDASNWHGYVDWICPPEHGRREVKRRIKKACLFGLGMALSALENMPLRSRMSNTGFGARLTRLAPVSSLDSTSPSRWPVSEWTVR